MANRTSDRTQITNPTAGNKFVSVNLNKSYGQHSRSYGSNRNLANVHGGGGGGGGGGGMVVLSRPRSSHKAAGTKLSVPPPLNLPSLRKEHERFDSLGSGAGPSGLAGSGSGSRPASSGIGWTKPATIALQEKEHFAEPALDGFSRGSSVYMPPSARSVIVGPTMAASAQPQPIVEKAAVLRGEDFPSLKAATSSSSAGTAQKPKEDLNHKPKQLGSDSLSTEQKDGSSRLSSIADVSSHFQSGVGNRLGVNGNERPSSLGGSRANEQGRKQEEYFPGPLPLVTLKPRSDWADDERDTSHGFTDRSRDHGFSRNDAYWDRDFDVPRVSVLPQKPAHNFDKRGQWDNETGKVSSGEVSKLDPYVRTASREGREGSSWRNSSFQKGGFGVQDAGNERSGVGAWPSSVNREVGKDNKYVPSHFRDNAAHDDPGKRDMGYGIGRGGKHPWNNTTESYGSRGSERNVWDCYAGSEQHNRNRVDSVQSSVSRSSFSLGGKGLPVNDPLLNFGREKRPLPKSEKSFLVDPFTKDFGASGFDGGDILPAGLVGVVKKKKDVLKQTDFHDPVRESFEAELERVQRMQEQERQRIIEEQERALELVRREEEERLRQAREQEERQRRLEKETREAAWRAEQDRIEALRKAEELRLAKEEEKQRIQLEEERRKQAAKQKLLELEQRIARRQVEASRATDVGDWDDSERMVERIITSASSDSSSVNRPFDAGSRPHFSRDISSTFVDRGKPFNSWRNAFENGSSSAPYLQEQDIGNNSYSPRRDSSFVGKSFMRKDYYGGSGLISSRNYTKGGISDSHLDEYSHLQGQRWNQSGDGDHFRRNTEIDSDFHENFVDRFGDGWSHSHSRGNPFPPYPERSYPNSEADGPYTLGRSRYSVRQPRVLPPPTLASVHKTYRSTNKYPGSSIFLENEIQYDQEASGGSAMPTGYDNRTRGPPEVENALQEATENTDHEVETTHRCDSQSSLSVSNPPGSPTHLSHDDLDGSGDSPEEGKNSTLSAPENESIAITARTQHANAVISSSAVSTADADDDDEWTTENNELFQEQEEYDEEEDYQEDEVHEGDDNIDLNREFEDMHLEEKGSPHMMDNLVLGFDEGVQVGMPNEEFERTSKDEEVTFMAPQDSINTLKACVSFDNACNDAKAPQPVDDSSSVFHDSEKPTQDLVFQPINAHLSLASESEGDVEASNNCMSTHHSVPTSGAIAPHSSVGPNVMSNVAAPSQAEPIKLQFGLFSGPSLIPSPVPAIQIGSIQMPLPLHPQVGAPLSHMHLSQPPMFHFSQLGYTSPISQGIMPLGPQTMPYVQPNIAPEFSFNHNLGGQMSFHSVPDTSDCFAKNEIRPYSVDHQPGISRHLSQGSLPSENAENVDGLKQGQVRVPHVGNSSTRTATTAVLQMDKQGSQSLVGNTSSNANKSKGQSVARDGSFHSVSKENMESKVQYPVSGGRGKRYVFTVKAPGSRSSGPAAINHFDSRGFLRRPRRNIQHTEFRVRETAEKRPSSSLVLSDQFGSDNKSNNNGRGTGISGRSGPKKTLANKLGKQTVDSATENSQQIDSGSRTDKVDGKESTKTQSIAHPGPSNVKTTLCSEEDVDAPLQSGIIRVFEQPGIEAPSDEDDFIEVRSKRQMLNDRRKQRETEIKAKSRSAKIPRKSCSTSQNDVAFTNYSKGSTSTGEMANGNRTHLVASEGRGMAKIDVSSAFDSSLSSQPFAPIGSAPLKIGAHSDLRSRTSRSHKTSIPAVLGGGKVPGPDVIFESKNKVVDNNQTSFGTWGNAQISNSQQVMALTQTQLDEAMKPKQFDSRASVGDLKSAANESSMPTSSILVKEKAFSSAPSPINSLLAGEKIQFGAVTSPTVLPSSSRYRSVSHGIGPPRSSRSDMHISHTLHVSGNDSNLFFDKEKHSNDSRGHFVDCEAEAEAAASAVAVAAISCDEIVGNGLSTCSVPVSDAKGFVPADIDGMAAGVASEQQSVIESRSEEPLSVSLPADLSVEIPPVSLWPPLQNQQNSSSQMISHFPAGPPHFPFYEMNHMMSGPVFAFGPHDESASAAQSEPQKGSTSVSGPVGSWHQYHSAVDSFYGPPTGFTGPFIAPPGGIPGVQGPPHMVVYNHFAPVGQFGQVGLSFMGTSYIPSGKQPDWKHNPTSSAMGTEGDTNMNMASSQRNPTNMPSSIQHLAPGSPLLPMASPLAMFDVSPFQSPDMTVQARWPHVPNSVPSIPLSMPSLQQVVHTSQYSHAPSADQPLNFSRFTISQTPTSDVDRNFSTASDLNFNQLPEELGLVDHSNSIAAKVSAQNVVSKAPSSAAKADVQNGNGSNSNNQNPSSAFKSQPSKQNSISTTQQYDHSSGYTNPRGGNVSHRHSSSGGDWSHRRMGFQGRNQSLGAVSSSKVKQIYVAKQSMGGGASTES